MMLIVCVVTPVALTVIVAVLCVTLGLAAAVNVTVPLLAPVAGETVNQVSLLPTVQFVLEVMLNDCCPETEEKLSAFGDTVSVGVAPACVTLMVCAVTPVPLTVIVAVRCVVPVLAAAVTVTVPLFVPVDGETVSHVSLLPTVQFVFEVMLNDCCPATVVKLSVFVDKTSDGEVPICVTLMV